jgi:hypothetical protein
MIRSAALIVIALSLTGLSGCSDDSAEREREAATAVEQLRSAFLEDDVAQICASLTTRAKEQAGRAAHGPPTTCERDVARTFALAQRTGGWRQAAGTRVTDVALEDDDRAHVRLALGRAIKVDVPLRRVGGRWLLDGFLGFPEEQLDPGRSPLTSGKPVSVAAGVGDAAGRCFGFYKPSLPDVVGGCEIDVVDPHARIAIHTAFGSILFAECRLGYTVSVDGRGRTWTSELYVESDLDNGCGDVEACESAPGKPLPWQGRIYAARDGTFRHHVDACLETCIGFFEGELVTTLVRGSRGWRLEADDATAGTSGFALRSDGRATAPGLEVRAAS